MKAELVEYDFTYQDWDACKGTREKKASNRAILFLDNDDRPVAIAIPENGRLKLEQVLLRDGQICVPVWSKGYTVVRYEPAPFRCYKTVKRLVLPPEHLELVMHAVVCCMKMDDLRNALLESIRAESRDFAYRI